MADAATTTRGLNQLLSTKDSKNGNEFDAANSPREDLQAWPDVSLSALYLDSTRGTDTKLLQAGDQKHGFFSLADNNWHHLDWDPEVGAITLYPVDATGTDGIEISSNPTGAANTGHEIIDGGQRELIVAGAPVGRLYVRRTNAGNSGNGSNTVKVNFICHGSRKMLGSTTLNAGVAHS